MGFMFVGVVGCADDPTKDDNVDDTISSPALTITYAVDSYLSPIPSAESPAEKNYRGRLWRSR